MFGFLCRVPKIAGVWTVISCSSLGHRVTAELMPVDPAGVVICKYGSPFSSLSLSQSLSVCLCLSCLFISLLIFVLSFLLFVFLPVGVCSFRCLLLSHVCLKIIVKMERKAQHNQLHMIQYQHFISSFICEIQTRKRLKRTLIYCFRFSFEKEKKKS